MSNIEKGKQKINQFFFNAIRLSRKYRTAPAPRNQKKSSPVLTFFKGAVYGKVLPRNHLRIQGNFNAYYRLNAKSSEKLSGFAYSGLRSARLYRAKNGKARLCMSHFPAKKQKARLCCVLYFPRKKRKNTALTHVLFSRKEINKHGSDQHSIFSRFYK